MDINTAGECSILWENHNGTNAVSAPLAIDAKDDTNNYVTGKILDAAVFSLTGNYYIF